MTLHWDNVSSTVEKFVTLFPVSKNKNDKKSINR